MVRATDLADEAAAVALVVLAAVLRGGGGVSLVPVRKRAIRLARPSASLQAFRTRRELCRRLHCIRPRAAVLIHEDLR